MKCPAHDIEMLRRQTQYGPMYLCTVSECDMLKWGDGPNTTPATAATREARHAAHVIFDKLWKDGHMTRTNAYDRLANKMHLSIDATHIGLFCISECDWVIRIANDIQREILMARFGPTR